MPECGWVISKVGFQWTELPRTFRICSVMGLIGGAYQTQMLSPLLFIDPGVFSGPPWTEGPLQVILFYSSLVALTSVLPVISVGGAVGLLTLPMSEDHRGILAFFGMLSSLYPILALAFNLLNFISSLLSVWPILIFGMVWVVLIWMVVKVLGAPRTLSRVRSPTS